jgi:hypothetical protein
MMVNTEFAGNSQSDSWLRSPRLGYVVLVTSHLLGVEAAIG